MIDRLTETERAELVACYERIRLSGHARELAAWVSAFWTSPAQPPDLAQRIFDLFGIFELLGKRDAPPFNTWSVQFIEPLPPLDWSKLPTKLHYLIKAAEKFGVYNSNDAAARAAARLTSRERAQLQRLSERLRRPEDLQLMEEWQRRHSDLDHKEAECVAYLLQIMEVAGIPSSWQSVKGVAETRAMARKMRKRQ
jgi:hypothetical protein